MPEKGRSAARFDRILAKRERLQDDAVELFDSRLEQYSESAARRIALALKIDPDEIFESSGSDGERVGNTDFEKRISSLSGSERIAAAVMSAELVEIEEFISAAGAESARNAIVDTVPELAGLAEATFDAMGEEGALKALDTVSAEALIGNYIQNNVDAALRRTIDVASAVRMQHALSANLGLRSPQEIAFDIADRELMSIPTALTEARTRLAEADRFCQEVVRRSVDPEGNKFVLAYIGPKGPPDVIRPFCEGLVGKYFSLKDFNLANNAQTGTHPRISGGGYNCRHMVQPVSSNEEYLKNSGLKKGTAGDIQAANSAAKSTRRRKSKRGRKR